MTRPRLAAVAASAVSALVLLAGAAQDAKPVKGAVRIDGSSTVYPIAEAIAEEFSEAAPGVNVTVGMSGTGGGFKRFGAGETDASNASRPIKPAEADACKAKGIEFVELPIAYDGLTIVVHKDNTWAKQLTVEQIKKAFGAEGSAKTWKDLDPSWPDEPLKVYSPGTDSGTFDYFKEVTVGKDGKIRSDISVSEDDNVLVRGVEGDKNAIGFFGYAYYQENKAKLRAIPVVNPKTKAAVLPSPKTIEDGSYAPYSRPLFIYVSKASLEKPAVAAYAAFAIDEGGELADEVGYVRLPAAMYDRARANLAARKCGTQMIDGEGHERHGALADLYK
jgi:phosphate transport system substrate-binding protein